MRCSVAIGILAAAATVQAGLAVKPKQQQQHDDLFDHHAAAKRDPGLLGAATGLLGLDSALKLIDDVTDPVLKLDILSRIQPAKTPPTSPEQAAAKLIGAGLGATNVASVVTGALETGENNPNNVHNPDPPRTNTTSSNNGICPSADPRDAPYSLPEAQLRAALYIPESFTYGAKPPVIFVPGTGSYGGSAFAPNLRKLLTNVSYADPVWLNVPHAMLGDAQQNAEYVAYAIHYVSALAGSRRDVSLITWSQGGLSSQWALTFWPSTRAKVANLLAVAADFRGTTVADLLCASVAGVPGLLCDPATKQQAYDSRFVQALRRHGGGPQQGESASAHLGDERAVGVANVEVQKVCGVGTAGAGFYEHAGILMHALTHALVVDALTHTGPGEASRIDLQAVCSHIAAPGLDLADVVATEALMVTGAALFLLGYPEKVTEEPALFPYAVAAPPS
ncbi:hypothetical protein PG989_015923 [Apiospora arundinis]